MMMTAERMSEQQERVPKRSMKIYNTLTDTTLMAFKTNFSQKCLDEGTDILTLTYEELAEITGISIGTIYKCIEKLSDEGWLVKIPAASRRFPNSYKLLGMVETDERKPHIFKSGREFVEGFETILAELEEKKDIIDQLNAAIAKQNALINELEVLCNKSLIVSQSYIPDTNLVQVIMRTTPESKPKSEGVSFDNLI